MANETLITVVGNLTGDPELRHTEAGAAVANFTIASTPRKFDRNANGFVDGETLFMRCSLWRDYAENVADTLRKGMSVIAQGHLVQRQFETKEGEKRTVVELQVLEIGPALRFATAQVTRANRNQPPQGGFNDTPPADNPWGGGGGDPNSPPF